MSEAKHDAHDARPLDVRSSDAAHRCVGLLEPARHVHGAVHHRGSREVLSSLLLLADVRVELAEAEMAVSDERAHAQRLGKSERLSVARFSFCCIHRIAPRHDLAQRPERPRFVRP